MGRIRKSALPICNYSQILYQFLTFTQNLKRSHIIFMYLVSIYCFFRYTCQKVFYTKLFIYHVSFFKKEKVTWSQIQTIKYRYKKKKQKFIFTTHDHKTITLRSDILYDGWADFEEYVLDMADIYEIAIN